MSQAATAKSMASKALKKRQPFWIPLGCIPYAAAAVRKPS